MLAGQTISLKCVATVAGTPEATIGVLTEMVTRQHMVPLAFIFICEITKFFNKGVKNVSTNYLARDELALSVSKISS